MAHAGVAEKSKALFGFGGFLREPFLGATDTLSLVALAPQLLV